MYLTRLDIHGIRNISSASFLPTKGINIIYGPNGSGKTSILEAIYLLGRGRTFRSRFSKTLINHQALECTVFGGLNCKNNSLPYSIGVSREKVGSFLFKVDGSRVSSASSLADALPLLLMNSDSFQLIEGGASGRRRFLDWGVFHVEQQFKGVWGQFQRALQQRNKLLRHGKISLQELSSWDDSFTRLSLQLNDIRRKYFEQAHPVYQRLINDLTSLKGLALEYYPGWHQGNKLRELLKESFDRDSKRRTTHLGPHKADIKVTIDGLAARDVLSRGQIKSLVAALIVSQGTMFKRVTNNQCIYLFDDLMSELDENYLTKLLLVLARADEQVFITGTEPSTLVSALKKENINDFTVFHVEHGKINSHVV